MKKIISIVIAALMILTVSLAVSAQTYNPNEHCDIELNIKKADPANVVKDGIISDGEYEKAVIDLTEDNTSLNVNYANSGLYSAMIEMLPTMEYYFSWDETHGLNFAVKYKVSAEQYIQSNTQPEEDQPGDAFIMTQLGIQFSADVSAIRDTPNERCLLYYAMGKNTETGEYLKGYFDPEQCGIHGNYIPTPGQDVVINYPGDGVVICEWSVPFSEWVPGTGAGDEVYFSICAGAGFAPGVVSEDEQGDYLGAIGLGDYTYGTKLVKGVNSHCIGILSAEAVAEGTLPAGNTDTGDNGGSNVTAVETYLTTDAEGNTVVETRIVEKNVNNNGTTNTSAGKRTGDPMIIIAAISAVSACGVVVFKKKH